MFSAEMNQALDTVALKKRPARVCAGLLWGIAFQKTEKISAGGPLVNIRGPKQEVISQERGHELKAYR